MTSRVFSDNEMFEFDPSGRMFKAYCPTDRPGACVRVMTDLYRFDLKGGDLTRSIDGNRTDSPNRSMIAGFGASSRFDPGDLVAMSFGVLLEPPIEGAVKSHHLNIGQIQSTGDAGEYHNPPFSIEVRRNNRVDLTHRVDFENTTIPGRNTAGLRATTTRIGSAPFEFGKVQWFDVLFKDSIGNPGGFIKVYMNGTLVVEYDGPTSRDNAVGVYPGWGLYRNPVDQELVSYLLKPQYGLG